MSVKARKEDSDGIGFHCRILWDQFIAIILTVKIKKMIGTGKDFTQLIQSTYIYPDIVLLSIKGYIDEFLVTELNPVHLSQSIQERKDDGSRR
jgi:hypothetical protein